MDKWLSVDIGDAGWCWGYTGEVEDGLKLGMELFMKKFGEKPVLCKVHPTMMIKTEVIHLEEKSSTTPGYYWFYAPCN